MFFPGIFNCQALNSKYPLYLKWVKCFRHNSRHQMGSVCSCNVSISTLGKTGNRRSMNELPCSEALRGVLFDRLD